MNKNSFDIICKGILNFEKNNDFIGEYNNSEQEKFIIKSQKDTSIIYEIVKNNQKIILKKVINQETKIMSSWLFDEENISQKDINTIIYDFSESIFNNTKNKSTNNIKKNITKKNQDQDESNVTGLFFANRMATIFPNIKNLIQKEKELCNNFRIVNFTKNIILPEIQNLISQNNNILLKKLGKVLSDLYSNGTLDVKSIITMVILNNLDKNIFEQYISNELKKAWECSLKYKNKIVKPEKIKTKKSLFSRALEYQNQQEQLINN